MTMTIQRGQEMTDAQLQAAAREALKEGGVTQSEAARVLDVHRSTVSLALNGHPPSRYAGTLKRLIEALTDFRIESETTTVHRVRPKT